MANEIQNTEKKPDFSNYIVDKLSEVNTALPEGFNKTRFAQNSVAVLQEISKQNRVNIVEKCGQDNVISGLIKGAFLGLDFFSKECYLIPYKNNKTGQYTLNFQVDYRGAKKLAKKYSVRKIKEISAEIVREGDTFKKWIEDGKTKFEFIPQVFNKGNIQGAFAYVVYEDGGTLVDIMTLDELNVTRSKSKAQNSMAWKDFTNEMYKKTVLHRLCKAIELDFETINQKQIFDDDVAIETDPQEIRNKEVTENENTIDFTEVKVQEANKTEEEPKAEEVPGVFDYEV